MAVNDEHINRLLATLSIEISDAKQVFDLVRRGLGSDQEAISIKDFCDSCMALKVNATTLDLVCLASDLNAVRHEIRAALGRKDFEEQHEDPVPDMLALSVLRKCTASTNSNAGSSPTWKFSS